MHEYVFHDNIMNIILAYSSAVVIQGSRVEAV